MKQSRFLRILVHYWIDDILLAFSSVVSPKGLNIERQIHRERTFMRFKVKEGQAEIFLESKERELLKDIDKELGSYDIGTIEDIIRSNISNNNEKSNYNIYTNIGPSLNVILSPGATNILLFFISIPQTIGIVTKKLKDEGVFTDKTVKLLCALSSKYGAILASIRESILRPKDWVRIESDVLISQEVTKLHSMMWRFDGTLLEFDAPIDSTIILANHFIRRTLEAIKNLNKEMVLELDKKQIEIMEKNISELKELMESIEKETDKTI